MSDIVIKASKNDQEVRNLPKKENKLQKKEKTDGLKEFFYKLKRVKNIHIYLAVIIASVVVLVYFSGFPWTQESSTANQNAYDYCLKTEERLKEVLSKIKGVGKVDVMINFESSQEIVVAYINSSTESTSTQGGEGSGQTSSSSSNTSNPQILQQQGSQIPLVLKTINPKVKGVIVVAEGADKTKVKLDLLNAVATVLEINTNLVNVYAM